MPDFSDPLLPKHKVQTHFLDVSDMTLFRKMRDGKFPAPVEVVSGTRYWRLSDLMAWRKGKRSGWPPAAAPVVAALKARTRHVLELRGVIPAAA